MLEISFLSYKNYRQEINLREGNLDSGEQLGSYLSQS